jgi:hypothetical protein
MARGFGLSESLDRGFHFYLCSQWNMLILFIINQLNNSLPRPITPDHQEELTSAFLFPKTGSGVPLFTCELTCGILDP